jgi:hypothetical protein
MKKTVFYVLSWGLFLLMGFCLTAFIPLQAEAFPDKQVGQSAPPFGVASSQDRLVIYDDVYYGQHHLILTFFPSAFTPV